VAAKKLKTRARETGGWLRSVAVMQPFKTAVTFALFGMLFIAFSSKTIGISMMAQIGIGVVYIVCLQAINDMCVTNACGDDRAFTSLTQRNWIGYNIGNLVAASVTLPLCDSHGFPFTLHLIAVLLLVFGALWAAAYIHRLMYLSRITFGP
jgi:hypothetical protein